jgi:ribonuclease P protein component
MQRLRPSQRLLTAEGYRQVFKHSTAKAGQGELLMLARQNVLSHHRLGLAVAKKHVPLAVNRNLIKRLAREQFRRLDQAQPTLDIVILTRPAARGATRSALNSALEKLFRRLGLEENAL